jgi:hypothetical protein
LLDCVHPSSRLASEVLRKKKLPGRSKFLCEIRKVVFGFPGCGGLRSATEELFFLACGIEMAARAGWQNVSDLLWRLVSGV